MQSLLMQFSQVLHATVRLQVLNLNSEREPDGNAENLKQIVINFPSVNV